MEQQGNQLDGQKLCCSICLDLLKDPVTTTCGHSYCMNCIKPHWDGQDDKKIYSCPYCRKNFTSKPVLEKSTMFAVLVEDHKKFVLLDAPEDHCYAGPEVLACDVCAGTKLTAVKSCLVCLASYCEKPLQPHYESDKFKKHKLVEPSEKLQENICSRHDEVMKMFCRTDQQCICYLCSVEEHKGHDTVSAAAERTERQRELELSRQQIQQRIQDKDKEKDALQQEVETFQKEKDALQQEVETVKEEKDALQQEVETVKKEKDALQQEVETVQKEKDTLQQEVETVKKEKDALQQEVETVKEEKDALQQEVETVQKENGALQQEVEAKKAEVQIVKQLRNMADKELEKITSYLENQLLEQYSTTKALDKELKFEVRKTDNLRAVLRKEKEEAKTALEQCQVSHKVQLAEAAAEASSVRAALNKAEDQLETERLHFLQQKTSLEEENNLLKTVLSKKKKNCRVIVTSGTQLQQKNDEIAAFLNDLNLQLEKARLEWEEEKSSLVQAKDDVMRTLQEKEQETENMESCMKTRLEELERKITQKKRRKWYRKEKHTALPPKAPPCPDGPVFPPLHRSETRRGDINLLLPAGNDQSDSLQRVNNSRRSRDLFPLRAQISFLFRGSKTVGQKLTGGEMEQQGNQLDGQKLCCSICLDLLKDPVTTTCGHSYCMNCIKPHWDGEDDKKIYSCPYCRKNFTSKPVLEKSTMFAVLVEDHKKFVLLDAPEDHCYAGPEVLACDVCAGTKLTAVKSCLVCLASYCEKHLQPHYESDKFKKHKLVEPSEKLQENICSRHDEVMKMFCRTDQQCICYLCSVEEHKGHDTVSAAAERTERQRELELSRQQIQQRIQDKDKEKDALQQEVETFQKEKDALQQEVETVKEEKDALQQEVETVQKEKDTLQQEVETVKKEKDALQQEVETVKEEKDALQQEVETVQKENGALQQEVEAKKAEVQIVKQLRNMADKELEKITSYLENQLLEQYSTTKALDKELKFEVRKTDNLRAVLRKEKEEAKTALEQCQVSHKVQLAEAAAETSSVRAALNKAEDQLETERLHFLQQKTSLEEENNLLKTVLSKKEEELQSHCHQWQQEKTSLLEEMDISKASYTAQLQQKNDEIAAFLNDLNLQLEKARLEWEEEKSSLVQAKDDVMRTLQEKEQETENMESCMKTRLEELERKITQKKRRKWYRKEKHTALPPKAPPCPDGPVFPPLHRSETRRGDINLLLPAGNDQSDSLQRVNNSRRSRDLFPLRAQISFLFRGSETVGQKLTGGEMEQQGNQLDGQKLCCSICLDLLKDPVTTTCGHSYCMNCIKPHWDGQDEKKIYSCPYCRKNFTSKPVLEKSTMFAVLVEDHKKFVLLDAPEDHCYAGPEVLACDVCAGTKPTAVKSCLVCLASYCEKPLQPHYESDKFKKHKLVEPSEKLQENICSRHDEVMKMFCRTDQQCICYLCSVEEHKGHDTVSAAAERTERQRELELSRQQIQQRIQDKDKEKDALQQEVETFQKEKDALQQEVETVKEEKDALQQEVETVKKEKDALQQEVETVQKEKDTLQQEVETVKKEKDALQQEVETVKEEKDALQQEVETVQKENGALQQEVEAKKAEVQIVKQLRNMADKELEKITSYLENQLLEQYSTTKALDKELKFEVRKTDNLRAVLRKEKEEAKTALEQCQVSHKVQLAEAAAETSSVRAALNKAEDQLETERLHFLQQKTSLEEENNLLKTVFSKKEEELQSHCHQWQQEKTSLLEEMDISKASYTAQLQQKNDEIAAFLNDLNLQLEKARLEWEEEKLSLVQAKDDVMRTLQEKEQETENMESCMKTRLEELERKITQKKRRKWYRKGSETVGQKLTGVDFYLSSLEEEVRSELQDDEVRLAQSKTPGVVLLRMQENSLTNFLEMLQENKDGNLNNNWSHEKKQMESDIRRLKALLDEAQAKAVPSPKAQTEALQADLTKTKKILNRFKMDLEHQTSENWNLQLKLKTVKKEKDALQQEVETVKKEKDTLQQEVETVKKEKDALQQEVETVQKENGALQQEVETVKKEKDALQQEVETVKKEKDALQQEVETVQKEKDALQQEVETVQKENGALQQDVEAKKAEVQIVKQLRNMADKELEKITSYLENQLLEQYSTTKALDKELKFEVRKTDNLRAVLRKEKEEAKTALEQCQVSHKVQLAEAAAETSSVRAALNKAEDQLETERLHFLQQKTSLEEENNLLKTVLSKKEEELQSHCHQWQQEKTSLLEEMDISKASYTAQLQQKNDEIAAFLNDLNLQLEKARLEWEEEKSSLVQAKDYVMRTLQEKEQETENMESCMKTRLEELERKITQKKRRKWYRKHTKFNLSNMEDFQPTVDFYLSSLEEEVRSELQDDEVRLAQSKTPGVVLLRMQENSLTNFLEMLQENKDGNLNNNWSHEKKQMESDIRRLKALLDEAQAKAVPSPKAQTEALQADLTKTKKILNRFKMDLEHQTSENWNLQLKLKTVQKEKDALQQEVETVKKEKDALQQEVETVKEEKDALQQEVETVKKEKDALQQEVETVQKEKDTLQQEVETVQKEKDTLQQEVETVKKEKDALQQEVETVKEEKDALQQEVETVQKENGALQQEVEAKKAEVQIVKQLRNMADKELEKITSYLENQLLEQYSTTKALDKELKFEVRKTDNLRAVLRKEKEEAKTALEQCQVSHKVQLAEAAAETSSVRAALNKAEDQLETERLHFLQQKTSLEEENNLLKTVLSKKEEELQSHCHQWQQEKTSLLEEMDISKASYTAQLQQKNDEIAAFLNDLNLQLEKARLEWEEEKSSLVQAKDDVMRTLQEKEQETENMESCMKTRLEELERKITQKKRRKWYRKLF
ncbi:centrosome-associated protein CEP250-like [Echeneis naucrates]|uniref:centrosome-associated protein CEP250-like n=1 Tax=Echeneis naucrates TaxID=173247 RepID=UPI001113BF7E|nr:centrosome-associated protein CEP250-like [Echeneis naucrates]